MKEYKSFKRENWINAFAFYSHESLEVSRIAHSLSKNTVCYRLVCDSIEFSLKGLLCCLGYEINYLKNDFGHDIYSLASTLSADWLKVRNGSLLKPIDLETIKKASGSYKNKIFHYPNELEKGNPAFQKLEKVAEFLVKELRIGTINVAPAVSVVN
ncbi:MAG: hypothetical protein WC518_00645 [Patescibacteria group bacterium]